MNALVTIETLTPAVVFAPGGVEGIISKLEADVRAALRDISSDAGREAVRALAYKVARSKTALDEMGKELVADIKKKSGAIDAERRIIRERLDALRDEVRAPLTAWEEAETARVEGHERELTFIITAPSFQGTATAAQISGIITHVQEANTHDWQEFSERAAAATAEALDRLTIMYNAAVQAERDAAELAELRKLKTEREERDRAEAVAKAAEIEAKRQAEAAAERKRIAAEQEKAREEAAVARALAQAKREAEDASIALAQELAARDAAAARAVAKAEADAAKAVEDERKRVAAAKVAEDAATAKREANGRHRAKVHKEAVDALIASGLSGPEANDLIGMISAGKIPHVSIVY